MLAQALSLAIFVTGAFGVFRGNWSEFVDPMLEIKIHETTQKQPGKFLVIAVHKFLEYKPQLGLY